MTAFWIVAGLLMAGALLFVVPPLLRKPQNAAGDGGQGNVGLYRDQLADLDRDLQSGTLAADQYEQARQDLERRLAEELEHAAVPVASRGHAGVAGAVIAGIPVLAIALYVVLGTPQALNPAAVTASGAGHAVTAEQIEGMVEKLAQRLRTEPGDVTGWSMLGRSYAALNRFPEASAAFAQAVKLLPKDAALLADYADMLAMAQGRRLAGEPRRIIARALAVDPNHFKALALAGSAAFEAQEYAEALQHWERLARALPPDGEMAASVAASIAEARGLAGGVTAKSGKTAEKPAPQTGGTEFSIRGTVRLSAELQAKTAPGDTVFVFARALSGPRAPLAVRRFRADQLPAEFVLDQASAMSPELTLAQFKEVVVGARITKSGNATPQRGDLEGLRQPVKVGATRIDLVIDTVVQ